VIVANWPEREPKVSTWKASPWAGEKLLMTLTFRVPSRVALPEMLTWSYCVPALSPPNLTLTAPAGVCV
jgi:hypothetical protein